MLSSDIFDIMPDCLAFADAPLDCPAHVCFVSISAYLLGTISIVVCLLPESLCKAGNCGRVFLRVRLDSARLADERISRPSLTHAIMHMHA